jgi:hypothetical protein
MADRDENTQYHVTLRDPMRIKLGGRTDEIVAFDATVNNSPAELWSFTTDCVYRDVTGDLIATSRKSIRINLVVPFHNIAGLAPQPFEKKA